MATYLLYLISSKQEQLAPLFLPPCLLCRPMEKGNKTLRRHGRHGKHVSNTVRLHSERRANAPQLTVVLSEAWAPAPRGRNYRKDAVPATAAFASRKLSPDPGKLHHGKPSWWLLLRTRDTLDTGLSPHCK